MSGKKNDQGKPPISLIPTIALTETANAFRYGAEKYGRFNFRKGIEWSRLIDAAMRHILAFNDGEDIDPESGNNHISHASANLCMLMEMMKTRPDLDDRYKEKK